MSHKAWLVRRPRVALTVLSGWLLLSGGSAPPARGAGAEDSFNSLFGAEAKKVQASAAGKERVEFARRLLASARSLKDDVELATLLCLKAFDFALAAPEGYSTAVDAMNLLVKIRPDAKDVADERLLVVLEKQYRAAGGAERRGAAGTFAAKLLAQADAKEAAGNPDEAMTWARRAQAPADAAGPTVKKQVEARVKALTARQAVLKRVEALRAKADASPRDARSAADLVTLLLVELDLRAEAGTRAAALEDPTLKRVTALALREPTQLDESEALELGDWYRTQSRNASPVGTVVALRKSKACYDHFFATHTKEDAQRLRAGESAVDVGKALAKAEAAIRRAPVVDLLPLIDPAKNALAGKWTLVEGGLGVEGSQSMRLRIPYRVPEEYDLRLGFTRVSGDGGVIAILPHKSIIAACQIANTSGIELVRGKKAFEKENPTRADVPGLLANGRRVSAVVQVRNDSVTLEVDGKTVIHFKTDYSDVAAGNWSTGGLGVGVWDSPVLFDSIELIAVTGEGEPVPNK